LTRKVAKQQQRQMSK